MTKKKSSNGYAHAQGGASRAGSGFGRDAAGDHYYADHGSGAYAGAPVYYDDAEAGKGKRSVGKKIGIALLVILLTLLVFAGVLGFGAYQSAQKLKPAAEELQTSAKAYAAAVLAGDSAAINESTMTIKDQMSTVAGELDGWVWVVASAMPVVGNDVSQVRTIVRDVNRMVQRDLETVSAQMVQYPVTEVMDDTGQVNPAAFNSYLGLLDTVIAPDVHELDELVDGLSAFQVPQLQNLVDKVKAPLDGVDNLLDIYGPLTDKLPWLLGMDGSTRYYLLMGQYNSEIRSQGGFCGAWALLSVTNGHITLETCESSGSFIQTDMGYHSPVTEEELALFGSGIDFAAGATNIMIDFPRVAEIWSDLWRVGKGIDVDGVIAVDPFFIQDMIGALGTIELSNGAILNEYTTAQYLLNQIYIDYIEAYKATGTAQYSDADGLFQEAAMGVFHEFTGAGGLQMLTSVWDAIQKACDDRNMLVWTTDEQVNDVLEDVLHCTGRLGHDETKPEFGVYVTNPYGQKNGWWLDLTSTIEGQTVNADGSVTYDVTVSMTNGITDEMIAKWGYAASGQWVLIGDQPNNPVITVPGMMIYMTYMSAPAGGSIEVVSYEGAATELDMTSYQGIPVLAGSETLLPQQTATIRLKVTTSLNAVEPLRLVRTATATDYNGV